MAIETSSQTPLTHAMCDYLHAIFKVQERRGEVTTTDIADFMQVSAASATTMIKKLHTAGLVKHAPYQGVTLTDEGRNVALKVIRRHRLLECFLLHIMKFDMHEIHDEADRLEPSISGAFEDKMDLLLGHPTVCPHGDPIPTKDGRFVTKPLVDLAEMKAGSHAIVRRVPGSRVDMLQYLQSIELMPDTHLFVKEVGPFGGPIHVTINHRDHALGVELCKNIQVEPLDKPRDDRDA